MNTSQSHFLPLLQRCKVFLVCFSVQICYQTCVIKKKATSTSLTDSASVTTDMASWRCPERYKMLARFKSGTSRYWSGTKCNARRTHSTPFGPWPTTRQYSAAKLYNTQLGPIFCKHVFNEQILFVVLFHGSYD